MKTWCRHNNWFCLHLNSMNHSRIKRTGHNLELKKVRVLTDCKKLVGWLDEECITLTFLLLKGVSETVVLQHRKVSTHWKKNQNKINKNRWNLKRIQNKHPNQSFNKVLTDTNGNINGLCGVCLWCSDKKKWVKLKLKNYEKHQSFKFMTETVCVCVCVKGFSSTAAPNYSKQFWNESVFFPFYVLTSVIKY